MLPKTGITMHGDPKTTLTMNAAMKQDGVEEEGA
jgi:hypothetical protein